MDDTIDMSCISPDPMSPEHVASWQDAVIAQGKWSPSLSSVQRTNAKNLPSSDNFSSPGAPLCTRCNVPMVVKRNRTTQDQFYGCPNYSRTKCKSMPLTVSERSNSEYEAGDHAFGKHGAFANWMPHWTHAPSDVLEAMYEVYAADIGDR